MGLPPLLYGSLVDSCERLDRAVVAQKDRAEALKRLADLRVKTAIQHTLNRCVEDFLEVGKYLTNKMKSAKSKEEFDAFGIALDALTHTLSEVNDTEVEVILEELEEKVEKKRKERVEKEDSS